MNFLRTAWHAPHGVGLYLRAPSTYAGGDPGAYAEAVGARWVAPVASRYSDAQLLDLARRGLRVWLFESPEEFTPGRARATLDALAARARRLGLAGVVVDTETAQAWASYGEAYAREFLRYMAHVARELPILWTTIPAWPYWRAAEELTRGAMVWASPQIYGVSDTSSLKTPAARADMLARWRAAWGASRVVPSLAAWGRDARAQAAYLAEFRGERAAIIWDTSSRLPAATLRPMVAHIGGGMSPRVAMVGLPLALVGAALLARGAA